MFEIDFNDYLWAYNNTQSRKITIYPTENNASVYQLILPIIDYINHGTEEEVNCTLEPFYDPIAQKSYLRVLSINNIFEN